MTVKYGKGDKVYIRLNKMFNPTNQMRRHNNTIMYVIAPMNDEWYFVSETPDNSSGRGMPVHIDEMEMRYQHVNNWSDEQWYMYNNSTVSYSGTKKEDKKPLTVFKNGDKITITLPTEHPAFARFDGRHGVVQGLIDSTTDTYQILYDEGTRDCWAYGSELKKREETAPMKEPLIVNAPLATRGFSAELLTQMGTLIEELGSAVEFFNDSEEVVSQIESLEFVVNEGSRNTGKPFKVHLTSHPASGKFAAVFEEME